MPWQSKTHSLSKCVVYFEDGNTGTFYSLDWVNIYSRERDPDLGLKRLHNLINKWGTKAKVALIYDMATGKELEKYNQGIKQNN